MLILWCQSSEWEKGITIWISAWMFLVFCHFLKCCYSKVYLRSCEINWWQLAISLLVDRKLSLYIGHVPKSLHPLMFQMLFSWKFCWKRCISPLSSTSTPWILHKDCPLMIFTSFCLVTGLCVLCSFNYWSWRPSCDNLLQWILEDSDIYDIMLFIASSYMRTQLISFMFGPIPFDEEDDHTDCIVEDDPCLIIGIWMFMNHGSLCLPVYSGRLDSWY